METVSFAYHTVLDVGFRMEIAAEDQLMLTRKCDGSLPLTAGRQGRSDRMALNSMLDVMWVTRMTMSKECEDEMIRVKEQGKWNGLKGNLERC